MKVDEYRQQTPPIPEIRAGAHSAKGLREENQDAMTRFQSRFGEVVLVADGMGGHQGGAVASDTVVQRFRQYLEAADPSMPVADALQQAAQRVNDEIYERGHSGDAAVAGMGSTLVLAVIRTSAAGREVVVANAGDSRAYLVRGGVLRQLTKDHTKAQRMVDAGMISAAQARTHPEASVLTRALGQQAGATVETYPPVTLQPGDGLLLCSDGLSGYATDDLIARAIEGGNDPNSVVRSLIDLALSSGSDDNITVQFLRFGADSGAPAVIPVAQPEPAVRRRWLIPAIIAAVVLAAVPAGWYGWRLLHPKPAPAVSGQKNQKSAEKKGEQHEGAVSKPQATVPPSGGPASTTPQPHPAEGGSTVPEAPRPASSGRDSSGAKPAGVEPPAATAPTSNPPAPHKKTVEVRIPRAAASPGWLNDLKKHFRLNVVVMQRRADDFAADASAIEVWYSKDAERDVRDAVMPVLKNAKRIVSENMPPHIDVLIVMPEKSR